MHGPPIRTKMSAKKKFTDSADGASRPLGLGISYNVNLFAVDARNKISTTPVLGAVET